MSSPRDPFRVLIVGGDEPDRAALGAALERDGHTVEAAADRAGALAALRQRDLDVVLVDATRARSGSLDVVRAVKGEAGTARVPLILLTAADDESTRRQARAAGAEDLLHRPVDDVELALRVRNLARLKRTGDQLAVRVSELREIQQQVVELNFELARRVVSRTTELSTAHQRLAVATDEREASDERLQESEAFARTLLDHSPDAIGMVDREGVVRFANPNFTRLHGEQLAGKSLARLDSSTDDVLLHAVGRAIATRATQNIELPLGPDADSLALHAVRIVPIADDGDVDALLFVATDIGELRSAEAELRRSRELLEQAQKMEAVGRLAGGVAHDFNNLLGIIGMYGAFVRDELPVGSGPRDDVEQVIEAANRGAAVTRQLLAFSRRQVRQPRVLDLADVVHALDRMLQRVIGEDVTLVADVAADVPTIEADPGQIEQILLNLCVNARDAMPHGGTLAVRAYGSTDRPPRPVIDAPLDDERPHAVIEVRDDGPGMDDAVLARCFEPFFTTKPLGKGTGLGLATVYGIVQQSGGALGVVTAPGQGTTFAIHLPAADEPTPPDDEELFDVPMLSGSETVLLVEDDRALLTLCGRTLRSAGFEVIEAACAEDAVDAAASLPSVDLLLTDVVLPRMHGKTLADRVVALHPDAAVLFMSGHADDALGARGVLDAGVELLAKPFNRRELVERVRAVLETPSSRWGAPTLDPED